MTRRFMALGALVAVLSGIGVAVAVSGSRTCRPAWKCKPPTTTTGTTETTPTETIGTTPSGPVSITSSGTVIEARTISGTGHCVTVAAGVTSWTIRNNRIEGCGRDGIHINRTTGTYASGGLIEGNVIRKVGQSNSASNDITIYADSTTVRGNDLTGTPNDAIDAWGDHLTITQNTIHDISNSVGNHNDALQSWTGYSPDDGAQGHPLTNLVFSYNVVRNVLGSNAHAVISEGPGYSNWTVAHNTFTSIGSIGLILGVWAEESAKAASSMVNVNVSSNAFCSAGANDGMEFNARSGSGSLTGNWLIRSDTYFHSGMSVFKANNDYWESTSNLALAATDYKTAVSCSEAEAKAAQP